VCTVVVRWAPGSRPLVLALRDELTSRDFDDPGDWWPDQPTVIGGRDRRAGGTWCATDVTAGVTALVLNRPERPVAEPGAPSRGVLPLLAVRHRLDWPSHLDLAGMASFALLLVTRQSLMLWEFDGSQLTSASLPQGTHMVTAGLLEEGRAERHLPTFEAASSANQWQELVTRSVVQDDPAALLVRHERDGLTYATVFAQVIEAEEGRVSLSCSRTPSVAATWAKRQWSTAGPSALLARP
jgi:uncharacterized protein with NRDE domain